MALSTSAIDSAIDNVIVIYPVTPNGVEHASFVRVMIHMIKVIYPVTPNGVEHTIQMGTRLR